MVHETTTKRGRCHDCAQGILPGNTSGFALWNEENDLERAFWYCLYCGSNHVDILDEDGAIIFSQGDMYET